MLELNGDVFKKVLKSVMNVDNPDLWPLLLHNLDLNSPMKTQGGEFWIVNKVDSSFHYCIVVLVCLCYVGVMTQLVIFFLQKVLSTKNLKVALFLSVEDLCKVDPKSTAASICQSPCFRFSFTLLVKTFHYVNDILAHIDDETFDLTPWFLPLVAFDYQLYGFSNIAYNILLCLRLPYLLHLHLVFFACNINAHHEISTQSCSLLLHCTLLL